MNAPQYMSPEHLVGMVIIIIAFLHRFNKIPSPTSPTDSPAHSKILSMLRANIGQGSIGNSHIYPPPRASTTIFKYRLYQTVYALIGLLFYLSTLTIPGLTKFIQEFINMVLSSIRSGPITPDGAFWALLGEDASPVALAIMVAALLPKIPPFSIVDASVRCFLYERASIPAQRLRERTRMQTARYRADGPMLNKLKTELVEDGFNQDDITYDEERPTTESLWAKASLLMLHINELGASDKYSTGYAIIRERDGHLSIDALKEKYESFKGDAKYCFQELRSNPDLTETKLREESFRQMCRDLLHQMYDFLARVSLHANYSERERIQALKKLGFELNQESEVPIPDNNDLVWLFAIVVIFLVMPLFITTKMGFAKAVMIGFIMFSAVITPLFLVRKFPELAKKTSDSAPQIAFPVFAAITSVSLGLVISVIYHSIANQNLGSGWEHYSRVGAPWGLLHGLLSALIAWRMQAATYPFSLQLNGLNRYRLWGSLRDALIFGLSALMVMLFGVLRLQQIEFGGEEFLRRLSLSILLFSVLGFFIPTWYRAQVMRLLSDRRVSDEMRQRFQRDLNRSDRRATLDQDHAQN